MLKIKDSEGKVVATLSDEDDEPQFTEEQLIEDAKKKKPKTKKPYLTSL